MPIGWIIALSILGVLILAGIFLYNGLVSRRIETQNAWSQIDVQLKRRYDLIPNLVETVKGYAAHEKETLERVIQARNAAMSATGVARAARQAENMLTGALRQLFALAEAYPDLKANENFLRAPGGADQHREQDRLRAPALQRRGRQYNTARETFPGNIIAGMFGFQPAEYFELDAAEAPRRQRRR